MRKNMGILGALKMPTIHLMHGFIGFGKTTIAKKIEHNFDAVRLTHDELMIEQYGRNPDDFLWKYYLVDNQIRTLVSDYVRQGKNVIMDYGFWSHKKRKEYYDFASKLTQDVVFHVVCCDMEVARKRVQDRTQNDKTALLIEQETFDVLLKQYEPWCEKDVYPVVFHNALSTQYIGHIVTVKMDRPLGSKHPQYGFKYPLNYGFVPYTLSKDKEELDAYVLGCKEPLKSFVGKCIGVVQRTTEDDDKLIVAPVDLNFSDQEIESQIAFQEQWFEHILIRK